MAITAAQREASSIVFGSLTARYSELIDEIDASTALLPSHRFSIYVMLTEMTGKRRQAAKASVLKSLT